MEKVKHVYFHPLSFDVEKMDLIARAYDAIYFVGEDEYRKVTIVNEDTDDVYHTKNRERVSEEEYESHLSRDTEFIYCHRLAFLEQQKICNLFLFLLEDYQILPVIQVEFYTGEEVEKFEIPSWFGEEVNERFFNTYAIWKLITT